MDSYHVIPSRRRKEAGINIKHFAQKIRLKNVFYMTMTEFVDNCDWSIYGKLIRVISLDQLPRRGRFFVEYQ